MKKRIITTFIAAAISSSTALAETVEPITAVTYTSLGVPFINSSFKTYMDYRTITDKSSPQYRYVHTWGWSDYDGFMRADGEKDLGISDNYYMIALGSYYGTEIGTKYKITTDTGNIFYGVLCDQKDDDHTNATHQYAANNNVVEFIVDTRRLNSDVKIMGSANVYMPLNGSVASIERIDFTRNGG
ncbi:MAG: hypothetical protein Q4G33_07790 [bacterium]|nr:hypothetical protein [bacterium]